MSEKIKAIRGSETRANEVLEWLRSQGAKDAGVNLSGTGEDLLYYVGENGLSYCENFKKYAFLFDIVELSEPKLRSYASMQEFLQAEKEHGPWLICKKPNEFLSHEAVKAIYADSCDIIVREHVTLRYNYSGLTERFEWQDGTPCGVLEGGES